MDEANTHSMTILTGFSLTLGVIDSSINYVKKFVELLIVTVPTFYDEIQLLTPLAW
jgi:hypothetical protein